MNFRYIATHTLKQEIKDREERGWEYPAIGKGAEDYIQRSIASHVVHAAKGVGFKEDAYLLTYAHVGDGVWDIKIKVATAELAIQAVIDAESESSCYDHRFVRIRQKAEEFFLGVKTKVVRTALQAISNEDVHISKNVIANLSEARPKY